MLRRALCVQYARLTGTTLYLCGWGGNGVQTLHGLHFYFAGRPPHPLAFALLTADGVNMPSWHAVTPVMEVLVTRTFNTYGRPCSVFFDPWLFNGPMAWAVKELTEVQAGLRLRAPKLPNNPLDDLIDQLDGPECVAELNGRNKRCIYLPDGKDANLWLVGSGWHQVTQGIPS